MKCRVLDWTISWLKPCVFQCLSVRMSNANTMEAWCWLSNISLILFSILRGVVDNFALSVTLHWVIAYLYCLSRIGIYDAPIPYHCICFLDIRLYLDFGVSWKFLEGIFKGHFLMVFLHRLLMSDFYETILGIGTCKYEYLWYLVCETKLVGNWSGFWLRICSFIYVDYFKCTFGEIQIKLNR